MFRILQEALNNASKYAGAKHVRDKLQCKVGENATCVLEIEDDGVGFHSCNVRPDAHGLVGIRQRLESRGGGLVIRSEPGKGALVRPTLPLTFRQE